MLLLSAEQTLFLNVSPATALIALGGLALYVASRAAADALTGGDPRRAGLRALGHCLPIAAVALLCLRPSMGRPGIDEAGIGRPPVAVALAFSTSVACLTLVLGIVTYLAPLAGLPPSRKAWPFVLPAALLALVAGFNGHLTWWHAGLLALLGAAVLNLWVGAHRDARHEVFPDAPVPPSGNGPPAALRWLQLALAVALASSAGGPSRAASPGWNRPRACSTACSSPARCSGRCSCCRCSGPSRASPSAATPTRPSARS
jgi:hypothetical protein